MPPKLQERRLVFRLGKTTMRAWWEKWRGIFSSGRCLLDPFDPLPCGKWTVSFRLTRLSRLTRLIRLVRMVGTSGRCSFDPFGPLDPLIRLVGTSGRCPFDLLASLTRLRTETKVQVWFGINGPSQNSKTCKDRNDLDRGGVKCVKSGRRRVSHPVYLKDA